MTNKEFLTAQIEKIETMEPEEAGRFSRGYHTAKAEIKMDLLARLDVI